jgi:hypothetical protein
VRGEEILERSAEFFESRLYDSEAGQRTLSRLERAGIEVDTLRRFRTGYAPGDVQELLAHLGEWGYSTDELVAAGVATHSDREYLHVLFHARVMFPIGDVDRRVLAFAGLATHLGPSWPLWVTSPEGPGYQPGSALFGVDLALPAIAEAGRALIKRDCVEVMRLHQEGRAETVGVIQSPITAEHLGVIAAALKVRQRDLDVVRTPRLDGVLVQPAGAEVDPEAFGPAERRRGSVPIAATIRSDWVDDAIEAEGDAAEADEVRPVRRGVYLAGILIGAGIPLGTLLFIAPDIEGGRAGATPALNVMIAVVAAAYLVLTVAVARVSARHRDRSSSRRMRPPWARGSGEWQPGGWTYHRVEEVLIGAALVSVVICLVLWMTIGGFLG